MMYFKYHRFIEKNVNIDLKLPLLACFKCRHKLETVHYQTLVNVTAN